SSVCDGLNSHCEFVILLTTGGLMDHKAFFLKNWEKEAPATRKVIGRIPQERSEYRADPKARTARDLAWLIIREGIVLAEGLQKGQISWVDLPTPATMQEILDTYDSHHDQMTKGLHGIDAARWELRVPFFYGGQEIMNETVYDMAWSFLVDMIHHRGQL